MKRLLLLILLLPLFAKAQVPTVKDTTLISPSTAYTPQSRYSMYGGKIIKQEYINGKYYFFPTMDYLKKYLLLPSNSRTDSLFALTIRNAGSGLTKVDSVLELGGETTKNTMLSTGNYNFLVNGNSLDGNSQSLFSLRTTDRGAPSPSIGLSVSNYLSNKSAFVDINEGQLNLQAIAGTKGGAIIIDSNDVHFNGIVRYDSIPVYTNPLQFAAIKDVATDSAFNARIDTNTLIKRENTVYAIGDSKIANGTYVNKLDTLLGSGWNVVNMGISGALAYGTSVRFADVTNGTAKYVIIRAGINDITQDRTASQIIADIQAMATKAHNAGIYVIVPTITPFNGNASYTGAREIIRNTVNDAIRNTIADIDKRLNFSLLVRDATDTTKLDLAYDSGDHLHENTAGYNLEAAATYAAVTFTKVSSDVTLNASRSMSFDQPLNTFASPVFNGVSSNTLTAFGTNVTGNPSILAQAGARNNPAFVAKYLLPDHAANLAEFKDYNDANLVAVGTGGTGTFVQTITPTSDAGKGILIKMPSATYSANVFELQDYLGTIVSRINQVGQIGATGVFNPTSSTNSNITFGTTGLTLSRNVADANHVSTVQNLNVSSTGSIQRYIWGSNTTVGNFGARGLTLGSNTVNANTFHVLRATNGLGTISVTAASGTVTGTGTDFQNRFNVGETITANGETHTISAIASDVSMTTDVWTNTFSGIYTTTNKNNFIVNANGKIAITKMNVAGGILYISTTAGNIEESAAITGLIKGNGTLAPSVATANTDYLPVASPVMTGTPLAPTAVASTNTTQVATTAHVFAERTNAATLTNKTLTTPVLTGYTVATLPAGTIGMMAYVTDATAPTYLGTLTGGGSVVTPVFYNGTAWVSH